LGGVAAKRERWGAKASPVPHPDGKSKKKVKRQRWNTSQLKVHCAGLPWRCKSGGPTGEHERKRRRGKGARDVVIAQVIREKENKKRDLVFQGCYKRFGPTLPKEKARKSPGFREGMSLSEKGSDQRVGKRMPTGVLSACRPFYTATKRR